MSAFEVRGRRFEGGTHIMGILNLTPDSSYPLSRAGEDVAARALRMAADGAEIIDLGGQSTRPGAKQVGALEEMARVIPAVEKVRAVTDVPLSVDTFYPEVADAALAAGADMINDVSCLMYAGMAEVAAAHGASLCIMHNRRESRNYDLMTDKLAGLSAAVAKAERAGVPRERIILDGGIGFNRGAEEDWYLLEHYDLLSAAGCPLLLGASRKSFLGGVPETRLTATMDCSARAARMGVLFVRVHDVKENLMAVKAALGK